MSGLRSEFAQLRDQLVGATVVSGWAAVRAAPSGLAIRGFRTGSEIATRRNGDGVQQLRRNLRRVVGPALPDAELDDLVARSMRSYGRYWLETFRLPRMDKRDIVARVDAATIGKEHIQAAVDSGRGFILALPHTGNYDVAGLWLVEEFGSFTTVAERLKPAALFDRFVEYRESLGMEVLALTGGEQPPTSLLVDRLKSGRSVCLVADRDLSRHGIEVDFFGEPARMPGGPAILAALTGAALLPVGLWFTPDGGWGQHIMPEVVLPDGRLRDRVTAGTRQLAHHFEQLISAHPTDWHMLQKLWLADLDPARI